MRRIAVVLVSIVFVLVVSLVVENVSAGPVPEIAVNLPGGATMEMVWIGPGAFMMGTTEAQEETLRSKGMWADWCENEHPIHSVTITQGFYLVGANLSRYTRDLGVAFDPSGLIFQYGFPNKEEIRWASYAS